MQTLLTTFNKSKNPEKWNSAFLYSGIGHIIMFLDVFHAALGLVRSNWLFNLMQVGGRTFINWLVIYIAPRVCISFHMRRSLNSSPHAGFHLLFHTSYANSMELYRNSALWLSYSFRIFASCSSMGSMDPVFNVHFTLSCRILG